MTFQTMTSCLRGAGYRLTVPRQLILAQIAEMDGHFTADSLHAALVAQDAAVDLSTVYRTLELLTALGILHPLHGTAPTEYERVVQETHHHLICETCGRTTELADRHLDDLCTHLLEQHDFVARIAHLAIPGTCKDCMPTGAESE